PQPCIRCGRCILSCPMGLSPVETSDAFKAQDTKLLTKLKADLCMECGVCSYVCPAKRPVTQTMSLAKEMQKSAVKKEANSNGK
ncbi:MAG: 4Fe-4S dicluster domain-containing protein, partial [Oscillospiraceae bacterium]